MNWHALKEMNCPSCGTTLASASMGYRCTNSDCDFKIGHDKFRSVVNNLYQGGGSRRYNPDAVDRSDWS